MNSGLNSKQMMLFIFIYFIFILFFASWLSVMCYNQIAASSSEVNTKQRFEKRLAKKRTFVFPL